MNISERPFILTEQKDKNTHTLLLKTTIHAYIKIVTLIVYDIPKVFCYTFKTEFIL